MLKSSGNVYQDSDWKETPAETEHAGEKTWGGVATEDVNVDLLKDVHRECVDLRQESEDKNEWEKEDEEVNPVTSDPQVILCWKLEAVESESAHTFATVGRGLETQSEAAAEDEVDWKKCIETHWNSKFFNYHLGWKWILYYSNPSLFAVLVLSRGKTNFILILR